jgi:hypothetical protein
MPDLAGRLGIMPYLARQIGPHRLGLEWLGVHGARNDGFARCGSPARRYHRCDGAPDPKRVEPLFRLGFAGLRRVILPPLARQQGLVVMRAIIARLTLPRPTPTPAPPGHD